jgi:hypothetical protein
MYDEVSAEDLRLYRHLGADHDLALGLNRWRLSPKALVIFDSPPVDDIVILDSIAQIVISHPPFDPAVLRAAAKGPWWNDHRSLRRNAWGPLNRRIMVHEAGSHTDVLLPVEELDVGEEMLVVIDECLSALDAEPIAIVDGEIEFELSVAGVRANRDARAAEVFSALGGETPPSITLLKLWRRAVQESWPDQLDDHTLFESGLDHRTLSDLKISEERVCDLRDSVMLRRFRAIVPHLPSWDEAFAAEHP